MRESNQEKEQRTDTINEAKKNKSNNFTKSNIVAILEILKLDSTIIISHFEGINNIFDDLLLIKLYLSGVRTDGSLEEVIKYMKDKRYKHIIGAHKVSIYVCIHQFISIFLSINL